MTTPNKDREEFLSWISGRIRTEDVIDNKREIDMRIDAAYEGYQAACANKNAIIEKLTAPPSEGEIKSIVDAAQQASNDEFAKTLVKPTIYYNAMEAAAKAAITKFLELRA